jgi:hypothetical protein
MSGFEYRRATWSEVCELGPQGWRLVPVPPIMEMRQVLGQMQPGEPLYVVEREAPMVLRATPVPHIARPDAARDGG